MQEASAPQTYQAVQAYRTDDMIELPPPVYTPTTSYYEQSLGEPFIQFEEEPVVVERRYDTYTTASPAYRSGIDPYVTNHILHFVLTVLTFGFWLPIWIAACLINHHNNRYHLQGGTATYYEARQTHPRHHMLHNRRTTTTTTTTTTNVNPDLNLIDDSCGYSYTGHSGGGSN